MKDTYQYLQCVKGKEERVNDILHKYPKCDTSDKHLVFFPGDVQRLSATMKKTELGEKHLGYSFEATLEILSGKFADYHLWLVKPCKYMYDVMCVYKNLVKTESLLGVPDHTTEFDGLEHLTLLIGSAFKQLDLEWSEQQTFTMVAFSKGCIVLNQLLYEISAALNDRSEPERKFVSSIDAMYWLDGGHSGETDVWVTDEQVLGSLHHLKHCPLHVHTTPYQTRDPTRPWKGKMKAEFVRILGENGHQVIERKHFDEDEICLANHFKVLDVFC